MAEDLRIKRTQRNNFLDVPVDELKLRSLLWLHHGCTSEYFYGDDGELQCSHPKHRTYNLFDYLDFRRDSVELIEWKLMNDEGKKMILRPDK